MGLPLSADKNILSTEARMKISMAIFLFLIQGIRCADRPTNQNLRAGRSGIAAVVVITLGFDSV